MPRAATIAYPKRTASFKRTASLKRLALAACLLAAGLCQPLAAAERRPVAAATIYPGEIIREPMIADADFPDALASAAYVTSHAQLIGKVARRTLLPGQAIPTNAVGEPKLVTIGAMVRVVYQEDGLTISTYASALQAGAAGDLVSLRNIESGLVVSGTVQPDGSVHVGTS